MLERYPPLREDETLKCELPNCPTQAQFAGVQVERRYTIHVCVTHKKLDELLAADGLRMPEVTSSPMRSTSSPQAVKKRSTQITAKKIQSAADSVLRRASGGATESPSTVAPACPKCGKTEFKRTKYFTLHVASHYR